MTVCVLLSVSICLASRIPQTTLVAPCVSVCLCVCVSVCVCVALYRMCWRSLFVVTSVLPCSVHDASLNRCSTMSRQPVTAAAASLSHLMHMHYKPTTSLWHFFVIFPFCCFLISWFFIYSTFIHYLLVLSFYLRRHHMYAVHRCRLLL